MEQSGDGVRDVVFVLFCCASLRTSWLVHPSCRLVIKGVPLHLPVTHVATNEVLLVAEKDSVPHGVDIWRREVRDPRVARVVGVAGLFQAQHLGPHLGADAVRSHQQIAGEDGSVVQ